MNIRDTCAIIALSSLLLGDRLLAQEPTVEELRQQVAELQARLAKLESRQAQAQASDHTIDRMLEDAERRSQLATTTGVTAGYDRGFFIKSADDAYVFRPGLQLQFRSVTNFIEGTNGSDDEIENGFEIRRARLRFDGNVFTKDLTYGFQWDVSRNDGSTSLLDAWVAYSFAPAWSIKGGQFKESVFHEKDVSWTNQLAAERSLVDAILGGNTTDRVQGIALMYGGRKDDLIRAELTTSDGANSKNTNFQNDPADFGFAGRFEYKALGDWSSYRDFTAHGTKETLLVLGGGADFTEAGDTNTVRSTVDAQWENDSGWGAYGALHGNFTGSNDADDEFDWGALGQVGYCVTKNIEMFGRWDVVVLDDDTASGEDTFNEFTFGANYFFGKDGAYLNRARITFDFVYQPDGSPSNQTGLGILASDSDEFVLRGQFQLQI